MSYFQPPSSQGYNDGYNSMERAVGPKPPAVMSYPPQEMRGVNGPRHFDQRNVDPRQEFRGLENNRFPPHQQYQPPMPQRVVDPRQAELRAMEARNALNNRGMEPRPMVNAGEMTRPFENRPMERTGLDRPVNNRMDPRMGYSNSLPNNMINAAPSQSNGAVNPVIGPPHVMTAMFPRPSVSEIVHIPQDLSAFAAEPKFQQILLRVKEQTLVNFISLHRVSDNCVESVTIDASTKEAAQLAKNLIETHLKLQIKVKAAETRLQKVQTDLFSTQGEIAAGQMVEFSIRSDLIGLAIGKKGSRIKQIETETGVSSINVNDNGHIMIYGPDSQSVQQAREQLELFEETFTLQPAQADWLSEKTNTSILTDLKKDANLMVAKINRENAVLEVVGTSSSVQLMKFLLATQLEYIDKQIEIEANEREAREKLIAVRKQYGLNSVPWKNRGPKSANSPNPVEPIRKNAQASFQNSIDKSKNSKDDFLEAKTDLVPFTFDDAPGFAGDKAFEEPLEPATDAEGKRDSSKGKKKNKEKGNESKQSELKEKEKDRKQGKTRTVEITVGKINDNENNKESNKTKSEKSSSNNNRSSGKVDKESKPQVELASLIIIPPPPAVPPIPPSDKQSNKGKKNKKQDVDGKEEKSDKKSKEPMLKKINNPFQEQQSVPLKTSVDSDVLESGGLEITFPKKVSGPPKEPPARVVTLISSTTVTTASNDKSKDPKTDSPEDSGDKSKGRNRGRNRKEGNSVHNKVDIISIVTKEQDVSNDLLTLKISDPNDHSLAAEDSKAEANTSKRSRRRRKQNEKGGKNDGKEGDEDNASPRNSNAGEINTEVSKRSEDNSSGNQISESTPDKVDN